MEVMVNIQISDLTSHLEAVLIMVSYRLYATGLRDGNGRLGA